MSHDKKIQKIVSDIGSERAVLSGICQYGKDGFIDVCDIISVDTFTIDSNKALYKCLVSILKETDKVDITSIIAKAEELHLTNLICKEKSDIEYLRSLFSFPLHKDNIRTHAAKIAKLEFTRKAQDKHVQAYKALQEVKGSETLESIISISEKPVFDLIDDIARNKSNNPQKFGSGSLELLQNLENNQCDNIGIPTPYSRYNVIIGGGLRRGGVDLIGARPKSGKSTHAINIGLHTAGTLKIPTLYLDTEMDLEPQQHRILACLSKVHISNIETGKFAKTSDKNKLYNSQKLLEDIPFFHISVAGKPFEEILSIIRRWIIKEVGFEGGRTNNCLIIYDYFKLMNAADLNNMQEFQALGFQISHLSDFSKEYDFPCLAYVQLNRSGIDKDTSDIISQSDRLLWLCQSASYIRRKTKEEIVQDGKENGNVKLQTLECRYGSGLEDGDYINLDLEYGYFKMKELNTKSDLIKKTLANTDEDIDF